MTSEKRIQELGLVLPPAPKPAGSYRPVVIAGGLAFLSGQISRTAEGLVIAGKVGKDLTLEEGRAAAKTAVLNAVSVIREFIGFERVVRLVRLAGYVQAAPDFYGISQVMDGASDLLVEIFGEQGAHARSAVGVASLPANAAVELEITLQLKEST